MLRRGFVALLVSLLIGAPIAWLAASGLGMSQAPAAAAAAFFAGIEQIGWVFVPQLCLAVAVLGAALQRLLARLAGVPVPAPRWIDPAIESALLLGMLGTLHGMVNGFVALTPGDLQPGPLVQSLGSALRSSFVGFSIALVGVWIRETPHPEASA